MQKVSGVYTSLSLNQFPKNSFSVSKRFQDFQEMGPRTLFFIS